MNRDQALERVVALHKSNSTAPTIRVELGAIVDLLLAVEGEAEGKTARTCIWLMNSAPHRGIAEFEIQVFFPACRIMPNRRRLRLLCEVRSDLPFPPKLIAAPRVYETSEIEVNQYGAVSIKMSGGSLGIKPHEFEWVEDGD